MPTTILPTSFIDYDLSDIRRQRTVFLTSVAHRQRSFQPPSPADYGSSDLRHKTTVFPTSDACQLRPFQPPSRQQSFRPSSPGNHDLIDQTNISIPILPIPPCNTYTLYDVYLLHQLKVFPPRKGLIYNRLANTSGFIQTEQCPVIFPPFSGGFHVKIQACFFFTFLDLHVNYVATKKMPNFTKKKIYKQEKTKKKQKKQEKTNAKKKKTRRIKNFCILKSFKIQEFCIPNLVNTAYFSSFTIPLFTECQTSKDVGGNMCGRQSCGIGVLREVDREQEEIRD
ncbi:hypothetical protein M5K25_015182 [Dendrobium thyrsiflorum]|uniref:Uncharacterized protein n=1 Tax=Dendrobium thyrsiflorum TaxID=117978 RepID=A0ABD0UWX3_DENTH